MAELVALRLLGGAALLLANGFFVTTEFALTRVRQFPASEFTGSPGLERAWEMTERLEIYLSGCQVGITVSSVGLGVVAEPAMAAVLDPVARAAGMGTGGAGHTAASVIVALAIINVLHVIVGEQAPTYLGVERSKLVAGYGATPLYYWTKVMSPVILFADRISKALLGAFGVDISRSWAEEELEGDEERPSTRGEVRSRMGREEVINALAIDRIPVSHIMTDREDVVALSTDLSIEENLDRAGAHPHVRYPLVDGGLSAFLGVVYTPALLDDRAALAAGEVDLEAIAAPPMTIVADTTVADAIDQFQAQNQELALVLAGGEVVGLVTATDAFEVITGELEDPLDRAASDAASPSG
jgi:CBS domain containing-hemolysin-like protein